MLKTVYSEGSVLMTAAKHGEIEFFREVVTCLIGIFPRKRVRVSQPYRLAGPFISEVMGWTWWSLLMTRATIEYRRTASIATIGVLLIA